MLFLFSISSDLHLKGYWTYLHGIKELTIQYECDWRLEKLASARWNPNFTRFIIHLHSLVCTILSLVQVQQNIPWRSSPYNIWYPFFGKKHPKYWTGLPDVKRFSRWGVKTYLHFVLFCSASLVSYAVPNFDELQRCTLPLKDSRRLYPPVTLLSIMMYIRPVRFSRSLLQIQ